MTSWDNRTFGEPITNPERNFISFSLVDVTVYAEFIIPYVLNENVILLCDVVSRGKAQFQIGSGTISEQRQSRGGLQMQWHIGATPIKYKRYTARTCVSLTSQLKKR